MKILAIDCSAAPVSCALYNDGHIVGEYFQKLKVTHSQTLLPMINSLLNAAGVCPSDIDCYAVSHGPGSFTGIRIGISAVKGLAAPLNTPCIGVSTLESIAYNFTDFNCTVCATMDARCGQLYCAVFRSIDGKIIRLTEDMAIMADEFINIVNEKYVPDCPVFAAGDGAGIFYNFASNKIKSLKLPDDCKIFQHASGVALCGIKHFNNNESVTPAQLLPVYLRLPQAERELNKKLNRS